MEVADAGMECCEGTKPMDWQSPRISFCQDIISNERILPPEKRRREEISDDSSTEFEFCMVKNSADPAIFGSDMLSADELFLDGKLLPLHTPPLIQHQVPEPCVPEVSEPEPENISIARHISLDNTQSATCSASNQVPPPPKSPKPSYRWKEIFRIGKLQVASGPKEQNQSSAETKPLPAQGPKKTGISEIRAGFHLKQPLSPRSIWPFTRSSSAGDRTSSRENNNSTNNKPKASSAPCSRSNSGGDSKLKARSNLDFHAKGVSIFPPPPPSSVPSETVVESLPKCEVVCESDIAAVVSSSYQGATCPIPRPLNTEEVVEAVQKPMLTCSNGLADHSSPLKRNGKGKRPTRKPSGTDGALGLTPVQTKGCNSPGRALRMRSPSGNFGRGSPVRILGRSGACNGSPGRVGSGKFMIRNLERCSANPKNSVNSQDSLWPGRQKDGLKVSDRPNSYNTGVRVLNVPVCMGHARGGRASNNRMFTFRGFFFQEGQIMLILVAHLLPDVGAVFPS